MMLIYPHKFLGLCSAFVLCLLVLGWTARTVIAQEYAGDGIALTQTFRIKSAHDNKFLRSSGRYIATAPLAFSVREQQHVSDDDAFLWVFVPVLEEVICGLDCSYMAPSGKYRIANVQTGWYLLRPRNSTSIYATVPQGHLYDQWRVEEGPNGPHRYGEAPLGHYEAPPPVATGVMLVNVPSYSSDEPADIALKREGGSATARPGSSFSDRKYVWYLEPGPGRDMIEVEIDSVTAIQTSTGRDGATNALTGSILFALDWGPTIASSGLAGAAKGAVKNLGKKLGKEGSKDLAKKSLKEVVKEASSRALREGIGGTAKRMARATGRGFVWTGKKITYAGKWVSKKARAGVSKAKKTGGNWVRKKKRTLIRYKKNPADALTWKNLGKTIKRSKSLANQIRSAPDKVGKLEDAWNDARTGTLRLLLDADGNPTGVEEIPQTERQTATADGKPGVAANPSVQRDLQSFAPDEHELALARLALKALEELEAPASARLLKTCESYVDFNEPPSPVNVVTPRSAAELQSTFKALKGALAAAGAVEATKEIEEIWLDGFLDPFGSAMDQIIKLTNNTPDQLEIKINGSSVWPNGGDDWRDISKGQTQEVRVRRVLPRQGGVDIHLIEYDVGSDDDNLGHLKFETAGLREYEFHTEALVHNSSEGSLYGIDFSVRPLSPAMSRQKLAASTAFEACNKFEEIQSKVESAFERLERYSKAIKDLRENFGPEGLLIYDNSMAWSKAKRCPAASENYQSLIVGEWRVGRYSDLTGEKLRDKTWTYTFSPHGRLFTPRADGIWSTKSFSKLNMWGVKKSDEDENDTTARTCELYVALFSNFGSKDHPDRHPERKKVFKTGDFIYFPRDRHRGFQVSTEDHMPVRSEASGLTIYKYDEKSRANEVLNFAREALWQTDYEDEKGVKHDPKPEARGGLDFWMEKIDARHTEIAIPIPPEQEQEAENFIKGTWDFVTYSHPTAKKPRYGPRKKKFHLTFTDDKLVIATFTEQSLSKNYHHFANGTWSYIGDNRVKVTLKDDKQFGFHDESFISKIDIGDDFNVTFANEDELYISEAFIIHNNEKQYTGKNFCGDEVVYRCLNWPVNGNLPGNGPVVADFLEKVRNRLGLPVPPEEEEEYKRLLTKRAHIRENARIAELWEQEYARREPLVEAQYKLWRASNEVESSYYFQTLINRSCRAAGKARKDNFYGEWKVGLFTRSGDKEPLPDDQAKWTFHADGTLTGAIDGKPWTATWKSADGCSATAKFDAETATHFNLETEVEINLGFHENGNKEIIFKERESATLISYQKLEDDTLTTHTEFDPKYNRDVTYQKLKNENFIHDYYYEVGGKTMSAYGNKSATDEVKARFVLRYDERIITVAGLANRCSDRWVNGLIRPGNKPEGRPVSLDVRNVVGRSDDISRGFKVYRVNFEGPEAELLYEGTLGEMNSALWEGKINTRTFKGVIGDEFVIVDEGNNCLKVYETNKLTATPIADRFKPSYNKELETKLYFNDELNARKKYQGCESYQWAQTERNEYRNSNVVRLIGNTNSFDIHVYAVDDVGTYLSKTPLLIVKPGTFETLNAREGEQYTVLEKNYTCEAVAKITSNRWKEFRAWELAGKPENWNPYQTKLATDNPQMIFGDGSVPIKDPRFLDVAQIENGCLDFGKVRSERKPLSAGLRVANTDKRMFSVHWIDYQGKYDAKRPVFVLEPGQTAEIADFEGAKYQILDEAGICVGIVTPPYNDFRAGSTPELKSIGDNSTPITGEVLERNAFSNITPSGDLTKREIANGCGLHGKITSMPSWKKWFDKTIMNPGSKPLIVHWVSYYGALEDREEIRAPKPHIRIDPGQRVTLSDITEKDVFVVLEENGQCVAVIQQDDKYSLDWGVPSFAKKNQYDDLKRHYVLRDRSSSAAFEKRVEKWNNEKIAHDAKLAELKAAWSASKCDQSFSKEYEDWRGSWEVGIYDRAGRQKLINGKPKIWKFTEGFEIDGTDQDGREITNQIIPKNCMFKLNGSTGTTAKVILHADGSRELFTAPTLWPEILYETGTVYVDTSTQTAKSAQKLELWARKLPSIGEMKDNDRNPNAVDETAGVGAPVGITANASDPDDRVTYSIDRYFGTSHELFSVNSDTGEVRVAAPLDFETARSHTVKVVATSADTSTSSMRFTISVRPVNEDAIGEIKDAYGSHGVDGRIYENVAIGQHVGITANAVDPDSDDEVTYSLSEDAGGLFAINSQTGEINVAGKLDWETVPTHHIEVAAKSSDGSVSHRQFEIPLADADEFDVGPVTDTDPAPDAVDETAPIGTPVGVTAFATDRDGSATVRYSIEDNRNGIAFSIDPDSGVLTLNMPLRREYYDSLDINVRATSSDGSTSDKVFTIAINDINQSSVSEITNATSDNRIHVDEDAPIGAKINLDADAQDADPTDQVIFSIANTEYVPFEIDPQTGVVTVANSMIEDEVTSYTLEIVAASTDGSTSRRSFEVRIGDVNEFEVSEITDHDAAPDMVDENAEKGTLVGVTAFAMDGDVSDSVIYAIDNSDPWFPFEIDSATGVITVGGDLNAETKAQHIIDVTASSTDGSSTRSSFEVAVNDVDEYEVRGPFDDDSSRDMVDENAPIGTPVGIRLTATDQDVTDSVYYELVDDAGGRFAVDPQTGVVTVADSSDFDFEELGEQSAYFQIVARAIGEGNSIGDPPSWFGAAEQYFSILVNDINEFDVSPVVDTDNRRNEIYENAPHQTEVGIQLFATDKDGTNNEVTYAIIDADGRSLTGTGPFSVNWTTGVVSVRDGNLIDYEKATQIEIIVAASSQDGSTSRETMFVDVLDVDETLPKEPTTTETSEEDPNTFVNWYENPQDPRGSKDYTGITEADWNQCLAANEDPLSPRFNNEKLFYDCVDRKFAGTSPEGPTIDLTPDQLANGCGEYGQLASEERDGSAMVVINNTGSAPLNIFRIDETGADVNYSGENYPLRVIEAGESRRFEARSGTIFSALDTGGNCVGIAKTPKSRNEYSFGTDGSFGGPVVSETPDGQIKPTDQPDSPVDTGSVVTWYENPQDPRGKRIDGISRYAGISEEGWNACKSNNEDPASANFNNESAFYDCLDVVMAADEQPVDLNPGGAYSELPNDVLQSCQGDTNCLDAAVMQAQRAEAQAIQNRIENEYANATQESLDTCEASHGWGSDDFFWCLGQTVVADNNDGPDESSDGREPGWDRETVFFEPAYNYCVNELGLDDQSEEYGKCYYAYDHRLGRVPGNDNQDQSGGQDPIVADDENAPNDYADASCQDQGNRVSEYLDREALVTIRNEGTEDLAVYWVNYQGDFGDYDGGRDALVTVAPGQAEEISAFRGFVFLITDMRGDCLGLVEAKESRNEYSFGADGSFGGPVVSETPDGQIKSTDQPDSPVDTGSAVTWYENPQYPRSSDKYSTVSPDEWEACYAANEAVNTATFNNEPAFWDCMDEALQRLGSEQAANDNQAAIPGTGSCVVNGEVSEYLDKNAIVTINNDGNTPLMVYWVNYEGKEVDYEDRSTPLMIIQAGQSTEIDAYRGFIFSVLDEAGNCLGLARARESRNSYRFDPDSADGAQLRRNAG